VGCAGEGLQLLVSCPIGKKAENDVTKEAWRDGVRMFCYSTTIGCCFQETIPLGGDGQAKEHVKKNSMVSIT
jgi:hypothetical protein